MKRVIILMICLFLVLVLSIYALTACNRSKDPKLEKVQDIMEKQIGRDASEIYNIDIKFLKHLEDTDHYLVISEYRDNWNRPVTECSLFTLKGEEYHIYYQFGLVYYMPQ